MLLPLAGVVPRRVTVTARGSKVEDVLKDFSRLKLSCQPCKKNIYINAPYAYFNVIFNIEFCPYIVQDTLLIDVSIFFFHQGYERVRKVIYELLTSCK